METLNIDCHYTTFCAHCPPNIIKPGLNGSQCNTNIKILTEYELEYILNQIAYRIRISNIFVSTNLTEYEYRIYLFLGT